MGKPSNPQEARTERDILRDVVRGAEHSVTEPDLRSTGVDIDLLESAYETNIRPFLDYLHGYKPLDEQDPLGKLDRPGNFDFERQPHEYVQTETWLDVLGRFGQLGQHPQALVVEDVNCYRYDRKWSGPENIRTRISLTRKGTWLLWYVATSRGGKFSDERLSVHKSVRELWEETHKLVPDGYAINGHYRGLPERLPLSLERGLREVLKRTIEERTKRLASMESSLKEAEQRISIVKFGS